MEKTSTKKLIFMSAFGAGESFQKAPLLFKLIYKTALKYIWEDKARQEQIITTSILNWTIVHPTRLTDEKTLTSYQSGIDVKVNLFSHISRTNVADFIVKQLDLKQYNKQTVIVTI